MKYCYSIVILITVTMMLISTECDTSTSSNKADDNIIKKSTTIAPPSWIQGTWKYAARNSESIIVFSRDNINIANKGYTPIDVKKDVVKFIQEESSQRYTISYERNNIPYKYIYTQSTATTMTEVHSHREYTKQ